MFQSLCPDLRIDRGGKRPHAKKGRVDAGEPLMIENHCELRHFETKSQKFTVINFFSGVNCEYLRFYNAI